jgi:hypothetical protein
MTKRKHLRDQIDIIRELVESVGGRLVDTTRRARHYQALIERGGKQTLVTISGSPSDHRTLQNVRAQTRRALALIAA